MNKNAEKIERFVKQEKRKKRATIIVVFISVITLAIFFFTPPMGEYSQVRGQVLKLTGTPSDNGNILILVVELESGRIVRARIQDSSYYKQGKRIILHKQESLVFGKTSYKFKEYVK